MSNATIPTNPSDIEGLSNQRMHEQMDIWMNWAKYMESQNREKDTAIKEKDEVAKIKDKTISELQQRETNLWRMVRKSNKQLDHYKDIAYHLFHRPYRPKPKNNKRSTKNKGNEPFILRSNKIFVN
jgi:hypothetical protein